MNNKEPRINLNTTWKIYAKKILEQYKVNTREVLEKYIEDLKATLEAIIDTGQELVNSTATFIMQKAKRIVNQISLFRKREVNDERQGTESQSEYNLEGEH